jgi:hypothetical protein
MLHLKILVCMNANYALIIIDLGSLNRRKV